MYNELVSVFTGWCQLVYMWFSLLVGRLTEGRTLKENFMKIKTFYILESELFHQDDSSETLNDTKQENATDAPVALYTGRLNCI